MRIKKTHHEGWDCVPELQEAVEYLDNFAEDIYEIKMCVRQQSTLSIVESLKGGLKDALMRLEDIDTDIDYETVYEDEDE